MSMRGTSKIFFGLLVAANFSCAYTPGEQAAVQGCTDEWFQFAEEQIATGDGQGHGPDPGSVEWRSTIEFKLGIRDDPAVPPLESAQWCGYIDEHYIENDT